MPLRGRSGRTGLLAFMPRGNEFLYALTSRSHPRAHVPVAIAFDGGSTATSGLGNIMADQSS